MRKVRILAIDGGGIRGILPGIILQQLEIELKKIDANSSLIDHFDFFAGTSTGGILTLAYLMPGKGGRPLLSTEEAVNIYLERGDEIFDTTLWKRIWTLGGVADEKYSAKQLEEALEDNFGERWLSELLKPCIISSYDIRNGKPHFFKQQRAVSDKIYDFKIKDVARATSAAPTYFEPARIKNAISSPFHLIDGGVFVNNPALAAYSEVRGMDFGFVNEPKAEDMMVVSLGTGSEPSTYEYSQAKDWGAVGWIKPIIEIMMSGNSMTVHYHLDKIFDTVAPSGANDYYRINPRIVLADSKMDNAKVENMNLLKEDALSYISRSEVNDMLKEIARKLVDYGDVMA